MKFSLLILTYNELISSKIVIPRIDKSLFHEIIVVDGGSNDGTIDYMNKENFKVIVQEPNNSSWYNLAKRQMNIAKAVSLGTAEATGDYVILFTPDGNMLPEKLPELITECKKGYEYVCVSRYKDDAKSDDDNFITAFGNFFFTKLVNVLFSANYTDVLGGYKSAKKSLWNFISDNKMHVTFGTQLAITCAKNNLKYTEIPGDEPKRIAGKSSMNVLINGILELYTILKAYFVRDLYKFH